MDRNGRMYGGNMREACGNMRDGCGNMKDACGSMKDACGSMKDACGCTMPRGSYVAPYRCNDNDGCRDNIARYAPEEDYDNCSCGKKEEMFEHGDFDRFPIGMCYVPWQCFRNLYEDEFKALAHGTIFKELDLDFYGRSCK